jgi:hypothetical protein
MQSLGTQFYFPTGGRKGVDGYERAKGKSQGKVEKNNYATTVSGYT